LWFLVEKESTVLRTVCRRFFGFGGLFISGRDLVALIDFGFNTRDIFSFVSDFIGVVRH